MSSFFHRCFTRRLLALSIACWVLSSHAQSRISADEAVALALSQTHVRQALDADVDIARSEVLAARAWPNPELQLSQERGEARPTGAARETTAVLSQGFELGGRRGLRIDAAARGVHAAQLAADQQRAWLRGEVLRAYSDVVIGERLGDLHARTAADLQDLAAVAERRHGAGDLSGYESRRIAQAGAQAAARAVRAGAESRAARARLAAWVGDAALTAELDANPPLPPVPAPGNELRSAELDALQARSEHARAQAQAERRLGLPVNVGLGTRRVEDAGLRDDIVVVELGVALPVFDRNQAARLRTSAEAERADAEYRRARLRTRSRRTAAADEARQLSASARVLLDSAVPEAARLTAIARASFAEGELDLVGLLDAHEAQSAVVEQALEQQSRALDVVLELLQLSPTLLATDSSHQPSN